MKSILISIRPEWVAKILNGDKTIEVRKTAPKCDLPVDVYIYCTKGDYIGRISNKYVGKVVAKFTLRKVDKFDMGNPYEEPTSRFLKKACVTIGQARTYADGSHPRYNPLYAWHIFDLQIFDNPKSIWQMMFFSKPKKVREIGHYNMLESKQISKAPQSWQYVEEEE